MTYDNTGDLLNFLLHIPQEYLDEHRVVKKYKQIKLARKDIKYLREKASVYVEAEKSGFTNGPKKTLQRKK